MEINEQLQTLKEVVTAIQFSRVDFISVTEAIMIWLNENNTNENCRLIDIFVSTEIDLENRRRLPEEVQSLMFDMGGALHDTHTDPEVARNFESTPEQLLERVRAMKLRWQENTSN